MTEKPMSRLSDDTSSDSRRRMRCPVCGYELETSHIGAMYCGPHGERENTTPAVRMVEVGSLAAYRDAEKEVQGHDGD